MTRKLICSESTLESQYLDNKLYKGIDVLSTAGRYMLFRFADYYPTGGLDDFIGAHDDIDYLKQLILTIEWLSRGNLQIFDKELNIVHTIEIQEDE